MFNVLERVARVDPKYTDIVLLENYAAFQNNLYELANAVPALGRFYHIASDQYEQARVRYISSIINHFEKLFQFGQKVENMLYTVPPEEVPSTYGLTRGEMRKLVKGCLSGVEKHVMSMYKRMQRQISSEELLPSLWDKCKDDFLDKYEALEALLAKCYSGETLVPSSKEMAGLFKNMY
ncbi:hypothetical protein KP509_31G058500 [Ceratopteris richardii]|uniref:Exocyst complex component Sec3 C-terminal domain-containing protein n=1 Tax=Ceratopteris richardii TaxID=49495 RepID=A0A8T2R0K8_CERRI|nr:hypothetical protein KP509_31G058500 [Ceratopteris richardii]